jgi:uncharacterized Zn-finger protein
MSKITEATIIDTRKVICDGGDDLLGHPKIFLEINPKINEIVCPYCGKHFIYQEHTNNNKLNTN